MNALDLFLCQWFPTKFTREKTAKMDKPVKEAEESLPWWAYRRQGRDSVEKNTDIQGLNLQTSSYKRIG